LVVHTQRVNAAAQKEQPRSFDETASGEDARLKSARGPEVIII
jgi:hypothetical protein